VEYGARICNIRCDYLVRIQGKKFHGVALGACTTPPVESQILGIS